MGISPIDEGKTNKSKEEIGKRLEEIEAGKVKLINWDDVKKKSQ